MTDKQFEKIKKGLQFHSEGGIDNLCTMTETTLRIIIEDAIKEIEAENERLTVSYETLKLHDEEEIGMLKSENAELKKKNLATQDAVTMQMYTNKANKEIADRQLTKAKELLTRYVPYRQITDSKAYKDLAEETEQFLNSEVEK